MASFCGFCGAKSHDERSAFCSDCGGKLEQSAEEQSSPIQTMPLPAIIPVQHPNVLLSTSFTNLISQEASIGKEISPIPASKLSRSFLDSIDSALAGDTLQEVRASDIPPKQPISTLPDFLSPAVMPTGGDTIPVDTLAPALKLPRVLTPEETPAIDRDTLEEAPRAIRPSPEAKSGHVPKEGEPNILLSLSMEEIVLKEKAAPHPPESIKPEQIKPALKPFPKLELPPKSILLAEPRAILSDGFAERLAKEPFASFFSLSEVSRAVRSTWVRALLATLFSVYLFASLSQSTKNGAQGLLLCLLFFRLIAEERQGLWRSLFFYVGPLVVGSLVMALLGPSSSCAGAPFFLWPVLGTALGVVSLSLAWFFQPRWRTLSQPIDGVLLGLFSGASSGVLLSASAGAGAQGLSLIFSEALSGGFLGYWLGLSWFRASEQKAFFLISVVVSLVLRVGFSLLLFSSGALNAWVDAISLLSLGAGYLLLFGFIIKLKELERN